MNKQDHKPILFQRFPELEGKLPWISLGAFPTPIEQLNHLGYENLWIKRDDLSSSVYGGNKLRKLEFILGHIKKYNKKRIYTFGGIGTNHGLATAIFSNQFNISCSLFLFDQPITPNVKQNLLLFHKYNAEIIYKKTFLKTALDYFIIQRIKTPNCYFLYPGGSNPQGATGFVNAAFELKSQIEKGLIPEPVYIFCPVGSSGTMAGLLLGCMLAGLKTTVIGVRVTMPHFGPLDVCTPKTVQTLAKKTYHLLKSHSKDIPEITIKTPVMLDDYLGEGYGYPTKQGGHAYREMMTRENITLDPCYTSKTVAAVLDHLKNNPDKSKPVLYWHTYNSVDLSAQAASVNPHELPQDIQTILNQEEIGYAT